MKKHLFVLLCLFLTGCHSSDSPLESPEKVCYTGPTVASLRPFIESIEVVKLESHPSIVIGPYTKICQEDSCFYIGDLRSSKLIYRYNEKGLFLDSIGKIGRGPGEYIGLNDFYVAAEADEISILSSVDSRFCRYRKNGEFIDQRTISNWSKCFTQMGSRLWIYLGVNNGHYPERLIQTDSAIEVTGKYLPLETQTLEPSIGPLFSQHKTDAYLFAAFDPLVYQITKDTVLPFLKFDYGQYNIPESYWKKEGIAAFRELNQKGFISISSFMLSDDYIITQHNQQAGENHPEIYYICGIKDRHSGQWNWVRQQTPSTSMGDNAQPDTEEIQRPDWYAANLKGFTKNGKLMVFLFAHQLEEMSPEDRRLLKNPELLENADMESDMFLFLLTLK